MKAVTPSNTTTSGQLTTVLSYGAILLLGYFVFLIVEPFLVPLAWSAVLAIFFYPLHEKVLRKMKPTFGGHDEHAGGNVAADCPVNRGAGSNGAAKRWWQRRRYRAKWRCTGKAQTKGL